MDVVRNSENRLVIYDEAGVALAELTALAEGPGFEALAVRLSALIGPALPRVAVTYREGLLEDVRADVPCEVLLIEEDRYDDPPVILRRRPLEEGDSAGVDAVLARVGAGPAAPEPTG